MFPPLAVHSLSKIFVKARVLLLALGSRITSIAGVIWSGVLQRGF